MSINPYVQSFNTHRTPQTEPIPGANQVQNSAGGYAFALDDFGRLRRFLILGSEGGSYYASERALTKENAEAVLRAIRTDGLAAVAEIVEVSEAGRAPKNDPAIFALALALKFGDPSTRRVAGIAVPRVCRTGTHLFQLAEAVKALGGWGRGTKRAFGNWYRSQDVADLSRQIIKYQSRGGWSHRDVLRKIHLKPLGETDNDLLRYAAGHGYDPKGFYVIDIHVFEELKAAKSAEEVVSLLKASGLPRECVPTQYLNDPEVWDALLRSGKHGMPIGALIRNLGKLSSVGLLKPLSSAASYVVGRLTDPAALKAARVHPLNVLTALRTYSSGRGLKGDNSWTPVQPVVDALNEAFYAAFENVEPAGKRHLLALDISGSMGGSMISGTNLSAREASAAMAMVTQAVEPATHLVGFTTGITGQWYAKTASSRFYGRNGLVELSVGRKTRLDVVTQNIAKLPMGGTDCALPMIYAKERALEVDTFVIYTDSETYAGDIHPVQALRDYRQASGIPAKLVVVGMTSTGFTIADPNDAGCLDVVGFDSGAPAAIAEFVR